MPPEGPKRLSAREILFATENAAGFWARSLEPWEKRSDKVFSLMKKQIHRERFMRSTFGEFSERDYGGNTYAYHDAIRDNDYTDCYDGD